MNDGIPRPLLALTAIVFLAALYVGVRDYFQKPREAQPTASAVVAVAQSNATSVPKKTRSPRLRRVRMSAMAANAANPAHSAEDTEKPFISQQSSVADAKQIGSDYAPNSEGVQAAHDKAEAAEDRPVIVGYGLRTSIVVSAFSVPQCIPLPNSVMREDVDAPYYENWAREYSCHLR